MPSHFLELPHASLEYARSGTPLNDTLTYVFLHEGLGCVELWKGFPERLAETLGREAILYSRQGYGRSSRLSLPRAPDYLENQGCLELRQVLDALELEDIVLVGHSDGATIALAYAAQFSDPRIRGVVAMAPHIFAEDRCIEAIRATIRHFEQGDLRQRLERYHGDNVNGAFHGWSDTWLSPAFSDWDITPLLSGIEVPLLLIQGEDDEYASSKHVELVRQHARASCQTVWLPRCGHTPHLQCPQDTLRAIQAFTYTIEATA